MKKRSVNSWLRDCFWLVLGIGVMYAFFLGTRPLNTPDEARYSEIPREMIASGHFLIPHLDYIKYFEKPDLFYWLQSISVKFFGLSEWSMRFWPAALGLLSAVIVYLAARRLYDRRTGIYSAIILATSLLYYAMSHLISIDMAVSFFITASLLSFLIAINCLPGQKRRIFIYLAAIAAALAVLTKGLIGLAFPCLIIFCWLLATNQWRLLTKIYLISGLLLFALVTLPWHIMMSMAQPGWAHFYFITQQFARYATPIAARPGPVWFFLMILLIGFFPWTVFLPQTIKHAWPKWRHRVKHQNEVYLLLWAGIILVFFSLSHSKLIPYILPTMPPLAILMGRFLASIESDALNHQSSKRAPDIHNRPPASKLLWINSRNNSKHFFIYYAVIQIVSIVFALALLITPHFDKLPEKNITYLVATLCSVLLFLGPFLVYYCSLSKSHRIQSKRFFIGLVAFTAILLPMLNLASTYYYNNSTKPLAEKVRPLIKPDDTAVDYRHYYQDLPFYLRRRVVLIHLADELQFGAELQSTKGWVWTKSQLMQHWQHAQQGWVSTRPQLMQYWEPPQQGRLFVFMSRKDYQQFKREHPEVKTYIIAQTLKNIVISNQETAQ